MTIRLHDRLLSNVLDFRAAQVSNPLAGFRPSIEINLDTVPASKNLPARPRRTRIWELGSSLHCSIIGTCLSTAELRHVLVQLKVNGMQAANEHDLHSFGVGLASKRELGAKLLQKALDRRHERAIKAFAAANDTEALRSLWKNALNKGDIPGAYWAVLTHPLTDEALIKLAFGDVHMLSHLVGAANRADIRRLRELEAENAGLTDELRRARQQIRDGFASRDQIIRQLNELLAKHDRLEPPQSPVPNGNRDDLAAMEEVIRDLSKKLARDGARRESAEARSAALGAALRDKEHQLQVLSNESEALRRELVMVEQHFSHVTATPADPIDLAGATILYVGGRANQIPQLRALVESSGGQFLHHDGGLEQSLGQLPGLISRADVVFFLADCVSHAAVAAVKRACRQTATRYAPLRASSLACLMAALPTLQQTQLNAAEVTA
ncbi:MAG: DUF2325 domain-containing protein [Xanthobacteraceae bacterium]